MANVSYRITYRNTKGKPGFVTVQGLEAVAPAVQRLKGKGYTMVVVNPPHIKK